MHSTKTTLSQIYVFSIFLTFFILVDVIFLQNSLILLLFLFKREFWAISHRSATSICSCNFFLLLYTIKLFLLPLEKIESMKRQLRNCFARKIIRWVLKEKFVNSWKENYCYFASTRIQDVVILVCWPE